jgi:FKBP-type peptidyl-prolyl cis-trans isomerase FkpA
MRSFLFPASLSLILLLTGCNSAPKNDTPPAEAAGLTTDDQKTIYALGLALGNNLRPFSLSPAEVEIVKRAIGDSVAGKPAVSIEEWGPKIDGLARSRAGQGANQEKIKGKEYQDKAAGEKGAERTASGLIYKELKAGSGANPKSTDVVKVHYRGTLIDGKEFDSSYKNNEPAEFPLNRVIPCWTEGVQKMKIGGKAQLVCPSDIAYGDNGPPGIPGGATLVFEVELLGITAPGAAK